ncbi:MAG TPA: FAD-binding oxidoreductase [Rhodospirillales bacterium]|nr:FAD-binding oxidoreductase [Rhodospirillales bacterium]
MSAPARVLVVGAGIVGTCCAVYLQREGFRVTLIDRDGPGEGCSSSNAGNFSVGSVFPQSMPGIWRKVPGMLMDPLLPLSIRWRHLPAALPWFTRFTMNSRRRRVEEIGLALKALYGHVLDAYDALLKSAGAQDLIVCRGRLTTYESELSLQKDAYALELRRRHGIDVQILSGDEARKMEPALTPLVKRAAFLPAYAHTVNPLRLTQVLAEQFVRDGGTVLRETVRGFEAKDPGPPRVLTDTGGHDAEQVVIAAGAYSGRMAAQLGSRVLLEAERGYHLSMSDPGVTFTRTIMSSDRFITITQMEPGLRVSGISEFSGLDAPPRYRLADVVLKHARDLIPDLNPAGASRWMGNRPSTPDSLPIISRSPHNPNVLFAFGHFGLTLGAISGKLIAEMATGRPTTIDTTPYRVDRF